jgi:glycosyltransferase involved in cell wall biosynthesis
MPLSLLENTLSPNAASNCPFRATDSLVESSSRAWSRDRNTRSRTLDVLHLINGEHFSGAERVQQLLGKCLPEFRIHPRFACLKPGRFPDLCGLDASDIYPFQMKSRFDFGIVSKITELVLDTDTDIIHAHTPRTAMIAGLVAKKCNLPWVYHIHSPAARDSTRSILNRINDWIEAYSLRSCDHIVTVSKSLRREMLSRGYSRNKLTTIANGVAEQDPIKPESRTHSEVWRLGMVALIRPRKGIEVLLQAIAKLGPERCKIQLDVVGGFETTEYETTIKNLVTTLGVQDSVRFLGFQKDIPAVMRQFDAMVLPSLFGEGMPMVVLEALACGVPIIATSVEGTPEVVRDGIEGVLAKPQDAESMKDAILRFTSDRSEWISMSHRSVRRHRHGFTDRDMASKMAKLYSWLFDTQP